MIRTLINGVDRTSNIRFSSLSKTDNLNSDDDTLDFDYEGSFDDRPQETNEVTIFQEWDSNDLTKVITFAGKTTGNTVGNPHIAEWITDPSLVLPTPPKLTSLQFDGVDDYVLTTSSTPLNVGTGSLTLESWIKTTSTTMGKRIIAKRHSAGAGFEMHISDASPSEIGYYFGSGAVFKFGAVSTGANINDGKWHHVALVFNRSDNSVTCYVDGVQKGRVVTLSDVLSTDSVTPLYIGRASVNSSGFFKGSIGDVRVWNYARTQADIQADMNRVLTSSQPGLIGYWKLSEGSGTSAIDSSPNGNNGTISGASYVVDEPHNNWVEFTNQEYSDIQVLNGSSVTKSTVFNGHRAEHLSRINLIEHVIREHGAGIFGNALTLAERIAWLKVNTERITCNVWASGSGPIADLLNGDGSFENTTGANMNSTTYDTTRFIDGSKSIKMVGSANSYWVKDYSAIANDPASYYVAIVDVYTEAYVSGLYGLSISDLGAYTNQSKSYLSNVANVGKWTTVYVKFQGKSGGVRINLGTNGSANLTVYFDRLTIHKVDKTLYDRIGVDVTEANIRTQLIANKVTVAQWYVTGAQWSSSFPGNTNLASHTSGGITKLSPFISSSSGLLGGYIDNNGFTCFLTYADPSNGMVASTLNIDYTEWIVELKPVSFKVFGGHIIRVYEEEPYHKKLIWRVSAVDYQRYGTKHLVVENYDNKSLGYIVRDINSKYCGSYYSTTYVEEGPVFPKIQFNYEYPNDCFSKMAKLSGMSWYVDYDRGLHFFIRESNPAPISISEGNGLYSNLTVSPDISQLKNVVTVRGGAYESEIFYDRLPTDGVNRVLPTKYRISKLVSATLKGVPLTLFGVEYAHDKSELEVLVNYPEQHILLGDLVDTIPTASDDLILGYRYDVPVMAQRVDVASINLMSSLEGGDGIYESLVVDETINSLDLARQRAESELNEYSNPIVRITFNTTSHGLRSGQLISVNLPSRGINAQYLIRSVSMSIMTPDAALVEYRVETESKLKGIDDLLFELFLYNRRIQEVREDEILDKLVTLQDNLTLTDALTVSSAAPVKTVGSAKADYSEVG